LLDVERLTGIQLTESFAMGHGSSVSGLYFAHPKSRYLSLPATSWPTVPSVKGMTLAQAERWLVFTHLRPPPSNSVIRLTRR
jgi:5-methyltetrahydrofolate--homocysteine methyltransferase